MLLSKLIEESKNLRGALEGLDVLGGPATSRTKYRVRAYVVGAHWRHKPRGRAKPILRAINGGKIVQGGGLNDIG